LTSDNTLKGRRDCNAVVIDQKSSLSLSLLLLFPGGVISSNSANNFHFNCNFLRRKFIFLTRECDFSMGEHILRFFPLSTSSLSSHYDLFLVLQSDLVLPLT